MRNTLFISFFLISLVGNAQISILSSHLPDADDTLITRNAAILQEIDLEATGSNFNWNFSLEDIQPLMLNPSVVCYDVNETPLAYQVLFNNPFDPNHNSDFALGVQQADVVGVSFENAYMYYKNSSTKYTVTGMGASINGIPLAAQMNQPDLIYSLPLTYGVSDSSVSVMNFDVPQLGYYGLNQNRKFECDGWGTLTLWGETFEVVRVRSVVNASDSVFMSMINMGIRIPRPETITYEWLSTEFNVPVLKVTTTGGFVSSVQVADFYEPPTAVTNLDVELIQLFPNPVQHTLNLRLPFNHTCKVEILNAVGERVMSTICNQSNPSIAIETLPVGLYTLVIQQEERNYVAKFIKE